MISGSYVKYMKYLYLAAMAMMVFTGFGQMPIFKRYYISDIPGLGWSADFLIGLQIHYYAAMVLLFLLFFQGTGYFLSRTSGLRLSGSGAVRAALLALVLVSGLFLLLDNLKGVSFSQNLLIVMDLTHLFGVMVFLLFSLVCLVLGRRWLEPA